MVWQDLAFSVQQDNPEDWLRVIDTARQSPHDIMGPDQEVVLQCLDDTLRARSVVVLISR